MAISIGKTYNYKTKYPDVLGGSYRNMKLVIGEVSGEMAHSFGDVQVMHNKIKALASENDPIKSLNVNQIKWLVFSSEDGEKVIIAEPYIDTIEQIGDVTKFTLRDVEGNPISNVDIGVATSALKNLGYYMEELE